MSKKRIFFIILGAVIAVTLFIFSFGSGTKLLWNISNEGALLLPLVVVSAIIDSINPCAFSVLLLTLAFLFSIGKLRNNILKIGGIYIAGIFVAYMGIGLGLLQALHLFNTPHFISKIAAVIMIILGSINVINEFFPSFPVKLRIPMGTHRTIANLLEKASMPAAFALGILVGLCEFPCTGGPYLMVISLLHDTATWSKGVMYLFFYNILFVSPLVVILGLAGDKAMIEKAEKWEQNNKKAMRLVVGFAMVLLGLFILYV